MIGSLVAMIAMYFIAQKLSSKRIFLAGCIIAAIFDVIIIISGGRNVPVLMICMPLILIFGQVVLTSTFAPFAASAVDYSEARTGVRAEGVTSAVTNLGIKLGVALATVIFGSLAAAAGFVSAAETQTQQAINAIHNALLFVPLIALIIIALIVAIFYNIEKDITKAEAKRGTAS